MALLDWISSDHGLVVEGEGVRLRPPRMADFAAWSQLRQISRPFLQPWEPTWPEDDLTRSAFRRRLQVYTRDMELGYGFPFLVFRSSDGALIGGLTLSNIRRGIAQAVTLGYWVGRPYVRKGYTLAAVRIATRFCFTRLGLHRVEAACLPSNEPSRNLLLKAGFSEEGKARAYLKINGAWRDHLLFGLVEGETGWEDDYSSGG
ncbi:MAG: GNAT family N-acetyltransferase [Caulobacteraceae bacterium]|nr:GNAT family N-acetyltransferase [Caulobacteraceae bacterium]